MNLRVEIRNLGECKPGNYLPKFFEQILGFQNVIFTFHIRSQCGFPWVRPRGCICNYQSIFNIGNLLFSILCCACIIFVLLNDLGYFAHRGNVTFMKGLKEVCVPNLNKAQLKFKLFLPKFGILQTISIRQYHSHASGTLHNNVTENPTTCRDNLNQALVKAVTWK